VVDAALAIVDADGIDGLSMRKLAAAIDVNPMTRYRVVPSKADLLRELVARVLADASAPVEASTDWEPVLRGTAEAFRAAVRAHPNVLPLLAEPSGAVTLLDLLSVPVLSLTLAGYADDMAVHGTSALTALVLGYAQLEAGLEVVADDDRPDPSRIVKLWDVAKDATSDVQSVLGFSVTRRGAKVDVEVTGVADGAGSTNAAKASTGPDPASFDTAVELLLAGLRAAAPA
jgi:AcrR family transcriptional regulator